MCINAATAAAARRDARHGAGHGGRGRATASPGIGSDIADPDAVESAYEATPLAPLLSLMDGLAALQADLGDDHVPGADHDVAQRPRRRARPAPTTSPRRSAGPVERVTLERSYHVATLDYDGELVCEQAVAFAQKVTAAGR